MKVAIAAGGTGGHVFPGLAVAERLMELGHEVVWFGTRQGFEARILEHKPIPARWITIAGVRGKGALTLLQAPLRLLRAVVQCWRLLRDEQPDVLLGMGGFVAGPTGLASWLRRVPLVVHEQNAAPGMTNRALSKLATVTLQAFPGALADAEVVGNPVRSVFAALPAPAQRQAPDGQRPHLLVVGGSQGAKALNELVPAALGLIEPDLRPVVTHQGGRTLHVAEAAYQQAAVEATTQEFIDDIAAAYAAADIVVCRSGALTVAELAAAGCPSILVPFPFAVDDHQTANAAYLADADAAILMPEASLTAETLAAALKPLLGDRGRRLQMAENARRMAWPDACQRIVDVCLDAGGAA